ncbi:MAG: hypothetical protein N0C84_01405 [Candidatus Thiodiazotropha taylori]|uniref:Uncharacterized protein n=1 Tax=Candidatus Thiodiazotropha taylori TaxID=2792791 RepID=A0A9E4K9K2_9GAMM|nr:hypothetical protein [Candidatus Thiodiazotropha taylori]MCW4255104.1 hypothetical protein [Candidatus Thiodiazotropha taylori]
MAIETWDIYGFDTDLSNDSEAMRMAAAGVDITREMRGEKFVRTPQGVGIAVRHKDHYRVEILKAMSKKQTEAYYSHLDLVESGESYDQISDYDSDGTPITESYVHYID